MEMTAFNVRAWRLAERLAAALRPLLADADEEWGHTPEALREAEDALTAWEEELFQNWGRSGATGTAEEVDQP